MGLPLFFSKLTASLPLGNLLSEGVRVQGGLMHTMYRLDTSGGTYAVKLLNSNVMKRPEALNNYREADRLEAMLQKGNIPIVPALVLNGGKMQELDGQYFYVYEWFDGKTLQDEDMTKLHCQKIGAALSQLHNIARKNERYHRSPIHINWDCYVALAKEQNSVLYDLLDANQALLYESQNRGNIAISQIPAALSICHNDMDTKNVLWRNGDFKIIDLECLGYANPYLELYESALCWSGYETCNINFEWFGAFMDAYCGDKQKPSIDCESMYYSNYGRLEWLEYNVKRALLIECDTAEEQELGIRQVNDTMDHVLYYHHVKGKILHCLTEIFAK